MRVKYVKVKGVTPSPNLNMVYFNNKDAFLKFIKDLYKRMEIEDDVDIMIFKIEGTNINAEQHMFMADDMAAVYTNE